MKFISLGINCAAATVIKELGLRTEAYPFDWVPGSIGIVLHCLETELKYFAKLGNPTVLPNVNDEYLAHQPQHMKNVPLSHQNYYGSHFSHYLEETKEEVETKFKRRCKRFLDDLKNCAETGDPITFVYANEYELYFKSFRDNVDKHYELLKIVEQVLIHQYSLKNFKIVCVNINKYRENTEHIKNVTIHWDPSFMFDEGCFDSNLFVGYKTLIKNEFKKHELV
jgi:hypothetical protein